MQLAWLTPDRDGNTLFDYMLNRYDYAAKANNPGKLGFGARRRELLAHVRELERLAAIGLAQEQGEKPAAPAQGEDPC